MPSVCLADFEVRAREQLSKTTWDFIDGGADEGITRDDNIAAFKKIRLRPRYLRDVSEVDTRTTILGEKVSAPIGISPTGFHTIACPDGEMSTARAAQAAGVCYITSTFASCSFEDIVAAAPGGLRWFQLYVQPDQQLNKQLVQRVESLGFKALVVTVDTPVVGNRRHDFRNRLDLKKNLMLTDLRSPRERNSIPSLQTSAPSPHFSWNGLSWFQSLTRLPIILKGILTKEDAELAVKHNVQGIIVSNHGGRQLDEVPSSSLSRTQHLSHTLVIGRGENVKSAEQTWRHPNHWDQIDALTEVVTAVNGKLEVYLDGGVRTGNDVLKALALGAKCVFLGRPILWGLACKGEHGVREVLNILKNEFHTSMTLTGCRSIAEINPNLIQFSRL
ncbi:2-Hydroxyacid oxidase 2 isoform X2 [Nycticebus coucang]|uniref:2-Hydroxyacid oxidase 2 isoform X2 n=1 Tax=Nycticebus coucang TaxID=9470 RepID=UPI00234D7AB1|nr:2-Hydroxyacid oxidase 2 isoform X2 [Nycticebus coucang]